MRTLPQPSILVVLPMLACAAGGLARLTGAEAAELRQPLPASRQAPEILVSSSWLAAHLEDPALAVLHVGSRRAEYEQGHIPGARFLALSRIASESEGVPLELPPVAALRGAFEEVGIGDGMRIVLYGEPLAAARAWMTLDFLGLGERAALLDGGLPVWRSEGRPVSRASPSFRRGALTLRPQRWRVVDADWVHERLGRPRIALVDARPAAEYAGTAGSHGGSHAAGHIPGAENLFWERMLVSREHPLLLPRDSLRAIFRAAGAAPGDTVVAYCLIGLRASLTYFVARLLGHEARLYDGSWVDWSRRGLPAEAGFERTEAAASR